MSRKASSAGGGSSSSTKSQCEDMDDDMARILYNLEVPSAEVEQMRKRKRKSLISATEQVTPPTTDTEAGEDEDSSQPQIHIQRPALTQEDWHKRFGFDEGKSSSRQPSGLDGFSSIGRYLRRAARSMKGVTFCTVLLSLVPILNWLPTYKWKDDFPNDLAAGFTVAVMHVPQGLAYGILANVPPIVGIYTAVFPVLIYIILGTSRHASMGTFAIISILISKPILETCNNNNGVVVNATNVAEDTDCAIRVATSISFMAGLIELGLGILRLGALNALLTDPLVSGFTTGAGLHVFSSQVKHILGIHLKRYTGLGRLVKTYRDLFSTYNNLNPVALGISAVCIFVLLTYDLAVKPKLAKQCRFPVPMQFIVVVLGTLTSYMMDLKSKSNIEVIGHVPTGLPRPKNPDFEVAYETIGDAFAITLIGYVITLSLSRICASRHNYNVDPNQELVAQGASNVFGSFFSSLPMSASMSRTMVQENAGGRTLITSAISVILLLVVLLFAGPLFQDLPTSILASIIVVSLKGILFQFRDLLMFGRRSLSDALVWSATFLGTVFLDVDIGLLVGLLASFMFLLWWGFRPRVELVGRTDNADLFVDADNFQEGSFGGSGIIRVSGNLNLANSPLLEGQIVDVLSKEFGESLGEQPKKIILDLTPVHHIDPSACQHLINMHDSFVDRKQTLLYVGVRGDVWRRMLGMKVFDSVPKDQFYPTLQDAVAFLQIPFHHKNIVDKDLV